VIVLLADVAPGGLDQAIASAAVGR